MKAWRVIDYKKAMINCRVFIKSGTVAVRASPNLVLSFRNQELVELGLGLGL